MNHNISEFFLCLCLAFAFSFHAETKGGEDDWNSKSLKRLYTTPMGGVYNFLPEKNCLYLLAGGISELRKPCDCQYCRDLSSDIKHGLEIPVDKKGRKNKRYLVLDFQIRAFPADTNSPEEFAIQLLTSEKKIIGSPISQLNSVLEIRSNRWEFEFASRESGYAFWSQKNPYKGWLSWSFRPDFEPLSIRIFFDQKEGDVGVNFNGKTVIRKEAELIKKKKQKINYLAIITAHPSGPDKYRTDLLEISSPDIRFCDSEEEINALEKIVFSPYPYQGYSVSSAKHSPTPDDIFKAARNHQNPDLQYAYALRFLYGPDDFFNPEYAMKLLEKAVKSKHVLAAYHLGLCYYRGYGVKVNLKKAQEYLKIAEKSGYENAAALSLFMQWDNASRPWTIRAELDSDFEHYRRKYPSPREHDLCFMTLLLSPASASTPMFSFKHLIQPGTTVLEKKQPEKPLVLFGDYAVSKRYIPAYWSKAKYSGCKNSLELLQQGVNASDTESLPDLLFAMAEKDLLTEKEFTPERNFTYADDPLYEFLRHVTENHSLSENINFISRENSPKKLFCQSPEEQDFLSALAKMILLRLPTMVSIESRNTFMKNAFNLLSKSQKDNPVAQYYLGRFYLFNDLPDGTRTSSKTQRLNDAKRFLLSAVQNGHPKARLLCAMADMELGNINIAEMKSSLAPLLKMAPEKVYFLIAEAYKEQKRFDEAKKFFLLARQSGEIRALYELALLSESRSEEEKKYWKEWLSADLKFRKNDRRDFYWPDPYEELDKWIIPDFFPEFQRDTTRSLETEHKSFRVKVRR